MHTSHDKRLWVVVLLGFAVLLYPLISGGGVLVWDVMVSLLLAGCALAALGGLLGQGPRQGWPRGSSIQDDRDLRPAAGVPAEHLVSLGARHFSPADDARFDAELRRFLEG
jgi:hypothetical protein